MDDFDRGAWTFRPNTDFLQSPDRMMFVGPMGWAEKRNGIRVCKGPFSITSGVCHFSYFGGSFSVEFWAFPIIAFRPYHLETKSTHIATLSQVPETSLYIYADRVAGSFDEHQLSEFLSDIQDSDLYDCLFDCQADYWPPGTVNDFGYERLHRRVQNVDIDPVNYRRPGQASQIERMKSMALRKI